ncbi:hypothetical protein [Pedobacter sp. UYP1]|uniref:hypothetical protein n=1 Tax=Pedobacter sp. UYP1 TaxID=1756396 RepID=UPI001E7C9FDB|nr:hypothetical protein [Pedobacter cryoconitis]
MKFYHYLSGILFMLPVIVLAQNQPPPADPLTLYLNKEKTHYLKFGGYLQVWLRNTQLNPGSKINDSQLNSVTDVTLRRVRLKVTAMPVDHLMLVLQLGPTNVNNLTKMDTYVDLLDGYVDYKINEYIAVGGGRSSWMGLSRYATGYTKTLLYETPLINLGDINRRDITQRRLGLFVKGIIGKLDYRFAYTTPYNTGGTAPLNTIAVFNTKVVKPNWSGYIKWQFFDKESNVMAQNQGAYLGKKKVLAIGAGFELQKDALWHKNAINDTISDNLKQFAADIFYDTPINKEKGTAFTFYGAYHHHDFGPNYTRILAIGNPANGLDASTASFNGSGNGYPVIGTGNSISIQTGFLLPYFNQKKKGAQLLPAVGIQYSKFERLADPMVTYDAGVSLLLKGHSSKFVFNAQSRPIFRAQADGELTTTMRKMMYVLMYHISID